MNMVGKVPGGDTHQRTLFPEPAEKVMVDGHKQGYNGPEIEKGVRFPWIHKKGPIVIHS
jgi:hypothetical protein